jgi:hypothetical protein
VLWGRRRKRSSPPPQPDETPWHWGLDSVALCDLRTSCVCLPAGVQILCGPTSGSTGGKEGGPLRIGVDSDVSEFVFDKRMYLYSISHIFSIRFHICIR